MCTQTGPKGLYHICIIISHLYHLYLNICISVIIILHAYAPERQKHPNTRPKAFVCVHMGPKGLSSHIICITVSEGERYCLMIFQTTFYNHVHKHIITPEISFPFYLIYLKSTQFYYHAFIKKR